MMDFAVAAAGAQGTPPRSFRSSPAIVLGGAGAGATSISLFMIVIVSVIVSARSITVSVIVAVITSSMLPAKFIKKTFTSSILL
jgi:hypothetical protein